MLSIILFLLITSSYAYNSQMVTNELQSKLHVDLGIYRDEAAINTFISGIGGRQKRDFPLIQPIVYDNAFPLPENASVIKFGYVTTDVIGYYQSMYTDLAYGGVRTWEYIINENGGVLINDAQYYVEVIAYRGGPDCVNFLTMYELLIKQHKIDFLIYPVSPGCPEVALLAEAYQILALNGIDFSLPYVLSVVHEFAMLNWTYSATSDFVSLGSACSKPVFDKGARTYAIIYEPLTGDTITPLIEGAAEVLNMSKVINNTVLSIALQGNIRSWEDQCAYLHPILKEIVKVDPDLLIASFGNTYTNTLIRCMHLLHYSPRALWLFTGSNFTDIEEWHIAGSLFGDFWVGDLNYTDPYLVSVDHFKSTYISLTGSSNDVNQISYAASIAVACSIALDAMIHAGSIEKEQVRAAMSSVNYSSIVGDIFLLNGTHNYNHPIYCLQANNAATKLLPVHPYNVPSVVAVKYPYSFSYASDFFPKKGKRVFSTLGLIFFVIGMAIVGILIIGGIVAYLINRRYQTVFIDKRRLDPKTGWSS